MGLAASQSRFLLLTARQNNLQSQITTLTNQNLALQRKSAVLSSEYTNKQNAQKVMYGDQVLDYATIMSPSTPGNNTMLTTSSGAVLLTSGKAGALGLSTTIGSGKEFAAKYATESSFIQHFIKDYDENAPEEVKKASGTYIDSAYKYDDNILNNAVVSVSAYTPLSIEGLLMDEEGNPIENASLQYAMGTQQNEVNSSVCIWTLNEYEYTEPNVHNVVNSFVFNASEEMNRVMSEALGGTTEIQDALAQAQKILLDKYAAEAIEDPYKNSLQNFQDDTRKGKDNPLNSTSIQVAEAPITHKTTTGISYEKDSKGNITNTLYSTTQAEYTGKNVMMNTAQLSAAYLNLVDAQLIRMMSKEEGDEAWAFAEYIEKRTLSENDAIAIRNYLVENGLTYTKTFEDNGMYDTLNGTTNVSDVDSLKSINPDSKFKVDPGFVGSENIGFDGMDTYEKILVGLFRSENGLRSDLRYANDWKRSSAHGSYSNGAYIPQGWATSSGVDIISLGIAGLSWDNLDNIEKKYNCKITKDPETGNITLFDNKTNLEYTLDVAQSQSMLKNTEKNLGYRDSTDNNIYAALRYVGANISVKALDAEVDNYNGFQIPDTGGFAKGTIIETDISIKAGQSVILGKGDFPPVYTNSDENAKYFTLYGTLLCERLDEVDERGNKTIKVTNIGGVEQKLYYNSVVEKDSDFAKNSTVVSTGKQVAGSYGNSSLLSSSFTEGAAGAYGSVHLAGDDSKSYKGISSAAGTKDDANLIEYYKSLYNALRTGGWKTDNNVQDSTYLSQQMLSGNACLVHFKSANSWNVMAIGNPSSGLTVEKDKDYQEKAKKEYEAQNAILKTRQAFLEGQIKTLETEAEAMKTEKESLSSIIENEQNKLKVFVSA